jgi:hypothetical protein
VAYTVKELENMQHELNWSGTAGLNIHSQKQLVDEYIDMRNDHVSMVSVIEEFHGQFHNVNTRWSENDYKHANKYTLMSVGIDIAQLISVRTFLNKIGISDDEIAFSFEDINELQNKIGDRIRQRN